MSDSLMPEDKLFKMEFGSEKVLLSLGPPQMNQIMSRISYRCPVPSGRLGQQLQRGHYNGEQILSHLAVCLWGDSDSVIDTALAGQCRLPNFMVDPLGLRPVAEVCV